MLPKKLIKHLRKPSKNSTQLFTCDSPRDWKLFPRSAFMQEERLHFQRIIFKRHSSQILLLYWKQALARHSKTSGQKSALQTTGEALQQPKKKRIEIAFDWALRMRGTQKCLLYSETFDGVGSL
ncbi:hypothetical protein CDAR_489661 [Caerostris darwini]|uniref:Uncharacterized protein n=1 Tax=Caerostris darwini TaxID=1538125 RepID=A0AAV4VIF6_9ARAC|nr:hypothetical protein CDAR_489641 [Caerostris darwini]GIY70132.1 hypothetical protein CDAR_489661 [Caerostris darwini]